MVEQPTGGSSARFRFPKSRRLLLRREFVLVQRRGKRFSIGPMLACVRYVDEQPTRVGITTSKRVGQASVRTRIRRLLRESIRRLFLPAFPEGIEVVFIAKNDLSPTLHQTVFDNAMTKLIEQLHARQKRRQRHEQPVDAPNAEQSTTAHDTMPRAVDTHEVHSRSGPDAAADGAPDVAGAAEGKPREEAQGNNPAPKAPR